MPVLLEHAFFSISHTHLATFTVTRILSPHTHTLTPGHSPSHSLTHTLTHSLPCSSWPFLRVRTSNSELASGIFFFFTMELLQAVQYYFIADSLDSPICTETINKILTLLGYLHICMQPYFCHVINCSLTQNPRYRDRYIVVKRFEGE